MKVILAKFFVLALLLGIGLWLAVSWFLNSGSQMATIDVRTLAHLRDNPQSRTGPVDERGAAATTASTSYTAMSTTVAQPPRGASSQAQAVNIPSGQYDGINHQENRADAAGQANQETQTDVSTEEAAEQRAALTGSSAGLNAASAQHAENAASTQHAENESTIAGIARPSAAVKPLENRFAAREAARQQRLADLGLTQKKAPEPTVAVDVSLLLPNQCQGAAIAKVPIGLKFRFESSIIRGESLNALESLVASYRECEAGKFILAENPLGRADATDTLKQMRLDEIKYFFIQHSVSIDAVQFPEK